MTSFIVQWDPTFQQVTQGEVTGIIFDTSGKQAPRVFSVSKAGFPEFCTAQSKLGQVLVVVELLMAHRAVVEMREEVTDLKALKVPPAEPV